GGIKHPVEEAAQGSKAEFHPKQQGKNQDHIGDDPRNLRSSAGKRASQQTECVRHRGEEANTIEDAEDAEPREDSPGWTASNHCDAAGRDSDKQEDRAENDDSDLFVDG